MVGEATRPCVRSGRLRMPGSTPMLDAPTHTSLEALLRPVCDDDAPLRCAACGALVTRSSERIRVHDAHEHEFTNPGGEHFHIGCFAAAAGAVARGRASSFWSWFDGHEWQVATCRACGVQLGWRFRDGARSSFFGLILAALRQPST